MTPEQEKIKHFILKYKGKSPWFNEWDGKIWNLPYNDIVDFFYYRFKNTLNISEYYLCMIYLHKTIPDKQLFIPYHEGEQYISCMETYQSIGSLKTVHDITPYCTGLQENIAEMIEIQS